MLGDEPVPSARRSSTSGSRGPAQGRRRRRRRRRTTGERPRGASGSIWSRPAAAAAAHGRRSSPSGSALAARGRRRLLPARDAERPRRRRRVGRRRRRGPSTESIGLLIVSGDEAAADPTCARSPSAPTPWSRSRCSTARGRLGRPRPAGHELPRARRDVREPRGPPAAPAPRGDAARPDELAWIAQLAARFGVDLAPYACERLRRGVARAVFGGISFGEVGERAPLRGYAGAPVTPTRPPLPEPAPRGGGSAPALQAALLRPGRRPRDRAPVPAAAGRGRALRPDARAARHRNRRRVPGLGKDGDRSTLRAPLNRRSCAAASPASRSEHAGALIGMRDGHAAPPAGATA